MGCKGGMAVCATHIKRKWTQTWAIYFRPENNCEELKIRLIGHSLGARVVLSSLDYLQNNELWNSKNFKIESVHLLGAAVDNEEISTNKQVIDLDATNWGTVKSPEKTGYGQAVQEEV